MSRHEFPSGRADGGQVQVAAHEDDHHERENTYKTQRSQQEAIYSEPHLPCVSRRDARPVRHGRPVSETKQGLCGYAMSRNKGSHTLTMLSVGPRVKPPAALSDI